MRFAVLATGFLVFALSVSAAPTATSPEAPKPSIEAGWIVEPVAFHGGSAPPDLAVDSAGVPHVLYCPPGDARFASRGVLGWTDEHLTSTPFGGICGNLALGPDDAPHVTTPYSLDLGCVPYGVRFGGGWDFSCFPGGVLDAVDSLGRPHAVTYWEVATDRYDLRHLWREADGTWQFEAAEPNAMTSFPNLVWYSLVLDTGDRPHVLYYDDVRGDVRYAVRDAAGWHVEVVEHIGALNIVGKEGSLVLDPRGNPHAAYTVRTGPRTGEVRYATMSGSAWLPVVVSRLPPDLGGGGFAPSIAFVAGAPTVAYIYVELTQSSPYVASQDLIVATLDGGNWSEEVVVDGLNDQSVDYAVYPRFLTLVRDACGHPHIAFYYNRNVYGNTSESGVYYATKGGPCDARSVEVDVHPETLNMRSEGKWVTAYVIAQNASVEDIECASLALNGVPAARCIVERADDDEDEANEDGKDGGEADRRERQHVLIAKFDRRAVATTLTVGENVVTLTGTWKEGTAFTATDAIRVSRPGR